MREMPLRLHDIEPQTINRRILVVDDEPLNQVNLRNQVAAITPYHGCEKLLDNAASGKQALTKVRDGL
jgi:CheY-like chemotaxis protein